MRFSKKKKYFEWSKALIKRKAEYGERRAMADYKWPAQAAHCPI